MTPLKPSQSIRSLILTFSLTFIMPVIAAGTLLLMITATSATLMATGMATSAQNSLALLDSLDSPGSAVPQDSVVTQPTLPEQSSQPDQSTPSTQPAQPIQPIQPTQPTQPIQPLQPDQPATLEQELRDKLSGEALSTRIILQSTGNYSITDNAFSSPNQFGLGPSMFMIRGKLDAMFDYKFQVNFNRPSPVMDAALGYRINPNLKLTAGAQKPDMGLDLLPSPATTDFADRARMVSTMTNTREIGLTLDGQFDAFDLNFGLYNGTGLSGTNDGNFMILAKAGYALEVSNMEQLYIGFNTTLNTTTSEPVGNTGYISDRDRLTYGVYATWRLATWFGAAEFMQTRFDNVSLSPGNDASGLKRDTITSFYATAGYHLTDTADLLFRWDHLSFDLENNRGSDLFILGWNQQLSSLMSFQTNLQADFRGDSEEFGLVGVFQFFFN